MIRKKANRSNVRQKLSFDDEEDDQDTTVVIKPKKTAFKPQNSKEPKERKSFKASIDVSLFQTVENKPVSEYSAEGLYKLKSLQLNRPSDIIVADAVTLDEPIDQEKVELAKKLREQKRLNLQKMQPENESEMSESEDEEVFEDYQGSRISFGVKAAKMNKEFEQDFQDAMDQDESWEAEQLRKGNYISKTADQENLITNHVDIPKEFTQIPLIESIPPLNEITFNFTADLETVEFELRDRMRAHESSTGRLEEITKKCLLIEKEIEIASLKTNFYSEFKSFIHDFSQMLDVKMKNMNEYQTTGMNQLKNKASIKKQQIDSSFQVILSGISFHVTSQCDETFEFSQDLLVESRQNCADLMSDVSLEFSFDSINQKIIEWSSKYPQDFEQCYAEMNIPHVYDFFVQMEIFLIDFDQSIQLKEMIWYEKSKQLLMNTQVQCNIVKSSVFKLFKWSLLEIFCVFDRVQVDFLLNLMGQFLEFFNEESIEMQKICKMLDQVVTSQIEPLLDQFNSLVLCEYSLGAAHGMNDYQRNRFLMLMQEIIETIVKISKFMSVNVYKQLLFSILRAIFDVLSKHPKENLLAKITKDVDYLVKLLQKIPADISRNEIPYLNDFISTVALYSTELANKI